MSRSHIACSLAVLFMHVLASICPSPLRRW